MLKKKMMVQDMKQLLLISSERGMSMENFDEVVDIIREMKLDGVSANHSNYNYFEITNEVAVKSFGIEYIRQRDNLKKEELLAFGDGENDIKMFETVGTSVAMGN